MTRISIGWSVAAAAMLGLAAPAAAQSTFLAANLLGQDVPGGKGDDKASANFNGEIDLKKNRICYYLDMDGVDGANGVHIRKADAAPTDPAALELKLPAPNGDEVCVSGDNAVLAAIAKEPGQYLIDVSSADHPDGAAAGKLTE